MRSLLPKLLAPDTQTKLAKESAVEIAKAVGSKAKSNRRLIIGEPYCPYKIAMHTKHFWCTVYVSDTSYGFTANHRKPTKAVRAVCDFCVNLKKPESSKYVESVKLPALSNVAGVDVYSRTLWSEGYITKRLLSERVRPVFEKINFEPVFEVFLNPITISVTSSLRFPTQCAQQVQVFRDLMTSLFEDACKRYKKASEQS